MASISRSLQEQIEQLEESSAPFIDQLCKAANFVGAYFQDDGKLANIQIQEEILYRLVPYKREEWLLIWLLKKMNSEQTARIAPSSWRLLSYLVQVLPVSIAARILVSKEAIVAECRAGQNRQSILLQTIQEAQEMGFETNSAKPTGSHGETPQKSAKKRKHSVSLLVDMNQNELPNLVDAILKFLNVVVQAGSLSTDSLGNALNAPLSAAYMKTAYIASPESVAVIIGNWITLCKKTLSLTRLSTLHDNKHWLLPFIELWNCRTSSNSATTSFSLHCARPILSLIHKLRKDHDNHIWLPELERVFARNLAIPAKEAYHRESNPNLLESLVKISVFTDVSNAPVVFEIFLRSCRPYKTRRRPEDHAWLTIVFKTIKASMPSPLNSKNLNSILDMLQLAIDHQFNPELESLRALTSEIVSIDICENWKLLAAIIVLDSNVFLISNEEDPLLSKLFEAITNACFDSSWTEICKNVVTKIMVPLMSEFSKARDLSGFLKHWFHQLSIFEIRRLQLNNFSLTSIGAWGHNMLHTQLRELLEPSLTIDQVIQMIDWLTEQVEDSPDAVCTILEAIAGSVTREEFVDTISLKLYYTMFSNNRFVKLNRNYRWRAWRIVIHTLNWANERDMDELVCLWETGNNPFLWWPSDSCSLLFTCPNDREIFPDCIERFRCACAALESSQRASRMVSFIKPIIMKYFRSLAHDVSGNFASRALFEVSKGIKTVNHELTENIEHSLNALIRCAFTEYPKTLTYFLELETEFKQTLHIVFDLASQSFEMPLENFNEMAKPTVNIYSDIWISALTSDDVLENRGLIKTMIDIMLPKDSGNDSLTSKNSFEIHALSQVPLEIFSKSDRERIIRSWLPAEDENEGDPKATLMAQFAIDPSVLALKGKIMKKYPSLYEGLEFTNIASLAEILGEEEISRPEVSLSLLKELVRLTISHALLNLAQASRKAYLISAFKFIQKKTKKAFEKKKNSLNFASIAIFEATLVELHKNKVSLNEMSIVSEDDLKVNSSCLRVVILSGLRKLLKKSRKELSEKQSSSHIQNLSIEQTVNSLITLGVTAAEIADQKIETWILDKYKPDAGRTLSIFLASLEGKKFKKLPITHWDGDVSVSKRNTIKQIIELTLNTQNNSDKLKILYSLFKGEDRTLHLPDKLLAIRHIIMRVDDTTEHDFDLTKAYILLSAELRKINTILPFCIVCETLSLMLRTKARCISQYAVDSTLGTVSILCSPKSPLLPVNRAGTIYLHLTQLLQDILMHHRVKLKGHFPLVQLSMQGLLRCLFQPAPYASNSLRRPNSAEFGSTPIWLSSPDHKLGTSHAESYARLLTLISDPTGSSVPGTKHNNLSSVIEKWKRMSLLFMQYVLIDFIRWQLELNMLPDVKEKLMPGWYAVLDTTTSETRKRISAELNANSRVIFSRLYSDYQKFGKWKGS